MSVAAVQSRIAQLEGRIAQVAGAPTAGRATGGPAGDPAGGGAASAVAGEDFATVLAAALSGAQPAGPTGSGALPGLAGSGAPAGLDGVATLAAPVAGAGPVRPATGGALVDAARQYLGVPYVWGGADASGMDCSGLVQRAFADLGVDVPRVARDQMTIGTEVPSLAQARAGDLVVTRGGGHIGIYVGDGAWIQAPYPGGTVKISQITSPVTTIRRVLPTGGEG